MKQSEPKNLFELEGLEQRILLSAENGHFRTGTNYNTNSKLKGETHEYF